MRERDTQAGKSIALIHLKYRETLVQTVKSGSSLNGRLVTGELRAGKGKGATV